jgi:hypothetical protein
MEILFLGTCACDYSPLLQTTYKDVFDKDARRSSCTLINGKYLIDCGQHCLEELRIAKVDLAQITDIFVTHFHSDHYNVECIKELARAGERTLRVWVRSDARVLGLSNVEWKLMKKGVQYSVAQGVSITGLLANHNESVFPQHILLEADGKKLFYALDGAWFLHETYYALKNANLDFPRDAQDNEHLNIWGAEIFTNYFTDFFKGLEEGKLSYTQCFHETYKEKISSGKERILGLVVEKLEKEYEMPRKNLFGKVKVWTGIRMSILRDTSNVHVVQLLIRGNTSAITGLMKTVKRNKDAKKEYCELAEELMDFEEKCIESLKAYLK